MKKIYILTAVFALLSMSLSAQLLPADLPGGLSFKPNGTATLVNHNKGPQFRMPNLASDEYLVGPYITDDFDATGISFGGYYNAAQNIINMVQLDRSDWESHLGDTIIGFRFALAGSTDTRVYDFRSWPLVSGSNSSSWDTENQHTWSLGDLMSGNTITTTQTVTAHNAITIYISSDVLSFRRIAVEKEDGTTVTEWTYTTNKANLPNNWDCTRAFVDYSNGSCCYVNGSATITISAKELEGVTDPVRVVIEGARYTTSYTAPYVTVNGSDSYTFSSTNWTTHNFNLINPTTQTVNVNTVEIGRGSTKNEDLPVSGYNQDYGYQNQMIYSAAQLCMASDASITSLTFYPEPGQGLPFYGSTVVVKLANTTTDNFGTGETGNKITSGLTTVATIEPVANYDATAWTINFSTPFTYTGGNLLVQMECPGAGKFAQTFFLGDDQSSNVSLTAVGRNGISSSTGNTSKFLPKATFTFTGDINNTEYLTLAGGEWHDFFLNEPVVFNVTSEDVNELLIGYTYYQQYSTSHAPTAVNSNSTGHTHLSYMYARTSSSSSYQQTWWNFGVSGSDNTNRPGDLAVQLIFKKAKEKTPTPEITYTYDPYYYHITATATSDNAEVTLTVNGTTVTGTGSVTINLGRGNEDYNATAVATAIEPDKLVSDEATENITIQATELDPSPMPSFTSKVLDLTVEVTGSGEGDVHMYVTWPDGTTQEVSYPNYYLERGAEDYTVTVTITNQTEDHYMTSFTDEVVVPKLENLDELIDGWEELPGTYPNDKVINWNDNVMFVDRFAESTAENNHPAKYTYVMTEDSRKLGTPRTTNDHIIPVQLTRSKVHGYYTEQDVIDDTDRKHVDIDVMNADMEMFLEKTPAIYYYTMDRSRTSIEDESFLHLSNLQNDGSRYVEMGNYYLPKNQAFEIGETGIMLHRFDSINAVLPATAPQGVDQKHYGVWGQDYMAYVPIIWTFGNQDVNKRAFWDRDHVHNSYGSPIWRTGVGQVRDLTTEAQMQRGPQGSTQWKDAQGKDCSLYFLGVDAYGDLPSESVSNIVYEPYMFRVWIQSASNSLRGCTHVAAGVDPDKPGAHWDGDGTAYGSEPVCVYEGPTTDGHLVLAVQSMTEGNNEPWSEKIQFGAVDNIDDLVIYVRFYYKSTGVAQGDVTTFMLGNRADDSRDYYAAEGSDDQTNITTSINGVYVDFNKTVDSVTYVNTQGMQSDKPFDGVNIVVTRFSDGTTSVTKIVK